MRGKTGSKKEGLQGPLFLDFLLISGPFGGSKGVKNVLKKGLDFSSKNGVEKNRPWDPPRSYDHHRPELFSTQIVSGG